MLGVVLGVVFFMFEISHLVWISFEAYVGGDIMSLCEGERASCRWTLPHQVCNVRA